MKTKILFTLCITAVVIFFSTMDGKTQVSHRKTNASEITAWGFLNSFGYVQVLKFWVPAADTINAISDSTNAVALSDTAYGNIEYANYLHTYGNNSPTTEWGLFIEGFSPVSSVFDSIAFWVRSDNVSSDSASVRITVKTSTATIANETYSVDTANTWERYSIAFTANPTGFCVLQVVTGLSLGFYMDISAPYLK